MPESTSADTAPATGATAQPATGKDDKGTAPATGATAPATGEPTSTSTPAADALPTAEEIAELRASNERMEKALKEANREAEKRRQEAKQAERDKLTAEEQAAAELKDLREQAEAWKVEQAEHRIERDVTRLAPTLGLVDPEAVAQLLDWKQIEFDEDGAPLNVKAVVEELIKVKPYLAGKPQAAPPRATGNNAGDGTSGGPKPNLTSDELAAAQQAGLSPERYAALRDLNKRGSTGVTMKEWTETRRTGAGTGAGGTS